jgi:hypothetical protein
MRYDGRDILYLLALLYGIIKRRSGGDLRNTPLRPTGFEGSSLREETKTAGRGLYDTSHEKGVFLFQCHIFQYL